MRLRCCYGAAIFLPLVSAVLGPVGSNNASTPTAQDGNRTIHYVTVGKVQNEFVPNSIVANVGDIVSFQFFPLNHSVIRSAYGWPCIPIEDSPYTATPFFSGFVPVDNELSNPPTWNLTVNSTDPIFYYCGAPGSCIDWGMLGVINPTAQTPLKTQISLARQADVMLLPGQEFPSEKAEASFSKLAHSATVTTRPTHAVTATTAAASGATTSAMSRMCMTTSGGKCGLSTGTVAGIAVGTAAAVLVVVALCFLLYRTRRLKQKLERERAHTAAAKVASDSGTPSSHEQNPHMSTLSSHRPYTIVDRPGGGNESRVGSWVPVNSAQPHQQSPGTPRDTQPSQSSPLVSANLNQYFRESNVSTMAELDSRR